MARNWQLYSTLPGGHRLFTTTGTASVYIADESGRTPDLTDDGPMWLDRTKPLIAGYDKDAGNVCSVPVVLMRDGSEPRYRVPVSVADILWLSDRYSWEIRTTGASVYRAVRVTA